MPIKKHNPIIKVVFDTSALHTQSAVDLFNRATTELIETESKTNDISIEWHIPEVTTKERRYQMLSSAKSLLPSVSKIEKFLKNSLNITTETLESKIDDYIQQQLKMHNIQVLCLDHSKVNLKEIIDASCGRLLPFSDGKHEKGFRDAMIGETFFQFIQNVPDSSWTHRVVFIVGDSNLNKYAKEKVKHRENVNVISGIDELIGLINILTSNVSEEDILEYQAMAAKYFFDAEKASGLYYKEKILDQITKKYYKELSDCPFEIGAIRNNTKFIVHNPQFSKKNRQRISWTTRIEVKSEILNYEHVSAPLFSTNIDSDRWGNQQIIPWSGLSAAKSHNLSEGLFTSSPSLSVTGISGQKPNTNPAQAYGMLSALLQRNKIVAFGKTFFEVHWSVAIDSHNNLNSPEISSIKFQETTWEVVA